MPPETGQSAPRLRSRRGAVDRPSGLHRALRLIRGAEADVHHLHVIEQKGEAAETPFIAILGLFLFLSSIFLAMVSLALTAYYLA